MHWHRGLTAVKADLLLRIDTSVGPRGVRRHRSSLGDARPAAIAVHTAGRTIDQRLRPAPAGQSLHQGTGARIEPPVFEVFLRRRCQMQHAIGQSRHARQTGRLIQIAKQGRDTAAAQHGQALGR